MGDLDVASAIRSLRHDLDQLWVLNADGSPHRCRELSLAITKVEEAIHWLEAAE